MHPQMPCYAFAVVFFFGAIELLLAGKRTLALLVNLEPLQEWQLEARKGNQVGGGVGAATRRLRRRALSAASNHPIYM